MEKRRMTAKSEAGYYFPECFDRCEGTPEPGACANCDMTHRTCAKLGAYEDTGLTPDGVLQLKKMYDRLLKDYGKLKKET